MFKKLVLIAAVLTAVLVTATPAFAAQGAYYVDTAYGGTEMGTPTQPFKTLDKAIAAAQANPDGGSIYTGTNPNNYTYWGYVKGVNSPVGGASLSSTALFILLGLACLVLVAAGWLLMRRSHHLPSRV